MMRSRLVVGSGFSIKAIINATGNSTVMMIENYLCISNMASRRVESGRGPLCRTKDRRIIIVILQDDKQESNPRALRNLNTCTVDNRTRYLSRNALTTRLNL